jgi:transposase InsO family protein
MPYTTNPKMPQLRARAVDLVHQGKTIKEVARYLGFEASTISRWARKSPKNGCWAIPTLTSRPKHHPKEIKPEIISKIRELRIKLKGRCAEVIHGHLKKENIIVSLSSVKRTLDRLGMTKRRTFYKHKRLRFARPVAVKPGDLVQLDTIHLMKNPTERMYIYTLLDVRSRWAYAWASERANNIQSLKFLKQAKLKAPFPFKYLQSDNGSEFSQCFSEKAKVAHRHSRVRRPNDNGHLERFNRTIQDECLKALPTNTKTINKRLPEYLKYYNEQRLHLGLELKTLLEIIRKCCEGID